jgi:plastocyanin
MMPQRLHSSSSALAPSVAIVASAENVQTFPIVHGRRLRPGDLRCGGIARRSRGHKRRRHDVWRCRRGALLHARPGRLEDRDAESGATAAPLTVVILTEAVAVKETGPKPTIEHFGEVYAFSPSFIAVHRDEPTRITLWNLQPDDEHDFMIEDRPGHALMHLQLAPLSKTSYVYTFHREGLFDFRCAVHQPEMNGQILVLPSR